MPSARKVRKAVEFNLAVQRETERRAARQEQAADRRAARQQRSTFSPGNSTENWQERARRALNQGSGAQTRGDKDIAPLKALGIIFGVIGVVVIAGVSIGLISSAVHRAHARAAARAAAVQWTPAQCTQDEAKVDAQLGTDFGYQGAGSTDAATIIAAGAPHGCGRYIPNWPGTPSVATECPALNDVGKEEVNDGNMDAATVTAGEELSLGCTSS